MPPQYTKDQKPPDLDATALVDNNDKHWIQQIIRLFLYYGRVTNNLLLKAINSLGTQQAKLTENTSKLVHHFLDHYATHSKAKMQFLL